jgi:type VI secretion system secreted protein VgrG
MGLSSTTYKITMANDFIEMRLESPDFSCEKLQIHRVLGKERIGSLFSFDIEVVSLDPPVMAAKSVLGARATLVVLRGEDDIEVRRLHGMIVERSHELDDQAEHETFLLKLVPRAYRLGLVETQELFLDMSVPEIIEKKLLQVGFSGEDFDLRLMSSYPAREIVVQYKESDLAFLSRLCEHVGISISFEHDEARDKIIFSDFQEAFPSVPSAPLRLRGDRRDVFQLSRRDKATPALYAMRDYNYRTPHVDLTKQHELEGGFAGGVVENGSHVKTPQDAEALAKVRAEERQVEQLVYTGESDLPIFSAGRRFPLESAVLGEFSTAKASSSAMALLLVEVTHEASFSVLTHGGDGKERHYKNSFRAIPEEHTYRPPRLTPRPRIHGLITGIVDPGPGEEVGREAKLDAWGRYMVRFLFDTAVHEGRDSHWIRMVQPHAGANYGMFFPLKPGVEVLLGFIDGDPDRPLIMGATYRPDTPSPVTSVEPTMNRLKTESGVLIEIHDA